MNTKYISSSVLKTSEFSRMRSTSENSDFQLMRYNIFGIYRKKSKFSFYRLHTMLKMQKRKFSANPNNFDTKIFVTF